MKNPEKNTGKVIKSTLSTFNNCTVNDSTEKNRNLTYNMKSKKIEELNLSTRTRNALRRAGIQTIDDLCKKTPDDIIKISGLGRKSIEELCSKMKELDLYFSED